MRQNKCTAANGRFGASGAVTRKTICAEKHRLFLVASSVEAPPDAKPLGRCVLSCERAERVSVSAQVVKAGERFRNR